MNFKIKLLFILVIIPLLGITQTIERVEPANWWTGMQWNNLQLLVYGENISSLEVSINSKNLQLKEADKTSNPNYLFLTVIIPPDAKPGMVPIDFKNEGKLVTTFQFELKARKPNAAQVEGFNASDAIYLITPDRFANGNYGNDQLPNLKDSLNRNEKFGRHGGDIKGIQDHLDYISELGFTAVWLNPVIENDMPKYSYHGYAASDFYAIDARFGSNEEYVQFIEEAKSKGLKVIMDMILNHCGSEHWFVKDPPTSDWLNNQTGFVPTNHKRQTIQDIHASQYDKDRFSNGWFVPTMPDLNQTNSYMATYLIQNTLWWIEYSGISGVRMDTYPYCDKDFMTNWTCAVKKEYPNFSVVGEEWSINPVIVSYWQEGKQNHDGYTSCLKSVMDFPIQHAMADAFNDTTEKWNTGLIKLYEMLANDFLYANPNDLVIFPDNHDMDRIYTQLNGNIDLIKMSLVYMATLRGIPQIYYGTEIAMNNDEAPGDHGIIRTDFPGGWDGDPTNGFTGKGLTTEQQALKEFTTKLFNWRKTSAAIHYGKLVQFAPENGVYAFIRTYQEKKVLVIFNKNGKPVDHAFDKYAELISPSSYGYDFINNKDYPLSKPLTLKPYTAYILEIK